MKSGHLMALGALVLMASPAFTQAPSLPQPGSVFLEELTWMEVRDAIAAGKTTHKARAASNWTFNHGSVWSATSTGHHGIDFRRTYAAHPIAAQRRS